MRAANERFWARRGIPRPRAGRLDPQLDGIAVIYPTSRLTLAGGYLQAGRSDLAAPHLSAIAEADIEATEQRVSSAFAAVGRTVPHLHLSARSRSALALLRSGAPLQRVLEELSAMPQ